jgi:uncharacterized membrane protein
MFELPNPLHPAIVHFPIVLILIGSVAAVGAVFLRRWCLPALAAVLLTAGAVSAFVATAIGEEDADMAGEMSEPAKAALDEHEDWGELTRNLALAAALLAIAATATLRWPMAARGLSVLAALAALAATYAVTATGHLGGKLVYQHAVGVNPAAASQGKTGQPPPRHDD